MTVKQWAVGDVLAASDMNVWTVPIAVIKPADTARNSTTTVADDPDLQLPVAASSTYQVTGVFFYDGPSTGTGDIKWTWTVPSGAGGQYSCDHQNISGSYAGAFANNWTDGPGLTSTQANSTGVGTILTLTWKGILVVVGTAGNLTFRWAQNTSSGTNTHVKAQSYLVAQRIA
jgi:hypothetical protein